MKLKISDISNKLNLREIQIFLLGSGTPVPDPNAFWTLNRNSNRRTII